MFIVISLNIPYRAVIIKGIYSRSKWLMENIVQHIHNLKSKKKHFKKLKSDKCIMPIFKSAATILIFKIFIIHLSIVFNVWMSCGIVPSRSEVSLYFEM